MAVCPRRLGSRPGPAQRTDRELPMADATIGVVQSTQRRRTRERWRRRWRRGWVAYRWLVLGGVWVLTTGLGYVGFAQYVAARDEARTPLSLRYLSLQLFVFESGAVPEPIPFTLEAARFLAPAVAAYTVLEAVALLLSSQ